MLVLIVRIYWLFVGYYRNPYSSGWNMKIKLTASKIATLAAKSARYRVWDSEIQGFHVRVAPTGKKTFILTYRHEGVLKEYTIGRYGNLTIEEARNVCRLIG